MEILQFILNYFLSEYKDSPLSPVFKLFSDNGFDIKNVLSNLDLSKIMPIINLLLSSKIQKDSPIESESYKTTPIKNVADKEIVYILNSYLGRE